MIHSGGCHCGNITVRLQLSVPPDQMPLRSCACSFCRAHATRTLSDRQGAVEIGAADRQRVSRYRFGSRTADYLLCSNCGVYVGAVCDTDEGLRAVVNANCLDNRALFTQTPSAPDYDGEAADARLTRRSRNWMPATLAT